MAKQNRSFSSNSGDLSTFIGPDAKFQGELRTQASMRIDGEVKGELHSADTITIGKDGIIEGNLRAKDIVVGGRVNGSISASGKITLESKSTLDGDLRASRLVIEEGAAFNGHSDMRSEGAKVPKIPQPAHINLTKD